MKKSLGIKKSEMNKDESDLSLNLTNMPNTRMNTKEIFSYIVLFPFMYSKGLLVFLAFFSQSSSHRLLSFFCCHVLPAVYFIQVPPTKH